MKKLQCIQKYIIHNSIIIDMNSMKIGTELCENAFTCRIKFHFGILMTFPSTIKFNNTMINIGKWSTVLNSMLSLISGIQLKIISAFFSN